MRSLVYAVTCYFAGVAGLAYAVLFIQGWLVPGVDSSPTTAGIGAAVGINLALISFWGVQHSVMARSWFKERWTRVIPAHTERATYCLASGLALLIVCVGWQPITGSLWSVDAAWLQWIGLGGWAFLLAASFEIDHFELFGLRQPWRAYRGQTAPEPRIQQRFLYRIVRHPIQLGVLIGLWVTPEMSVSRFFFSSAMTTYIFVGLYFEERALVRELGESYEAYRRRVPMLIPFLRLPRFDEHLAKLGN